ncbi:MAG: SBBP repeat-containing protein [Chloroflexota bacterium]
MRVFTGAGIDRRSLKLARPRALSLAACLFLLPVVLVLAQDVHGRPVVAGASSGCTRHCPSRPVIVTVGFSLPTGIAVDRQGNAYIADSGSRIRKVSPKGKVIATWGAKGSNSGQYDTPNLLALDAGGNVYVADTGNSRVQKLSPLGLPLAQWGVAGSGPGQFKRPLAVAVGHSGEIYVTDSSNNRVVTLSASGLFRGQWTANLHHPAGLAVGPHGSVYVTDAGNNRIEKFGSDGHSHVLGSGVVLNRPTGIAVDGKGNLYVVERSTNRVCKLSPHGTLLATWGRAGSGVKQWAFRSQNNLNGVVVDRRGTIWVADTGNNRIKQLSPTGRTLVIWR